MKPTNKTLSIVQEKWSLNCDLKFIRKVENWIYKDAKNGLFVRITEPSHRSFEQIASELDWLFFLQKEKIEFAHPVVSQEGKIVEVIEDDEARFYVCVFKEAKGVPLVELSDFTPSRMKNWGKLIASLHQASMSYQRAQCVHARADWDSERNYYYIKDLCTSADEFYLNFNLLEAWIRRLPKDKSNYGMIHADIHHGNFFVDHNDEITLFDFDDCHHHFFAYDLAVPLFNLSLYLRDRCSKEVVKTLYQYFYSGYLETINLKDDELKQVEIFILYRSFVICYWAKKNLQDPELSDNVREWMNIAITYCQNLIRDFNWDLLLESKV